MSPSSRLIALGRAEPCQPWPRRVLPPLAWAEMAAALPAEPALALLALWADPLQVHALFRLADGTPCPVSTPVEAGYYAALSPYRPAAAWFERMVQDLWGHAAADARDDRPWLDHGTWPQRLPMAARPLPALGTPEPPELRPIAGAGLHQEGRGPVHGLIEEPAHLRLTADGEQVRALELRLGYAHKGTLALIRGKSPRVAARFAARLAGDATVAHSLAFACAAEAASGALAPPRAQALRAVMAELERLASHTGVLAGVAMAAAAEPLAHHFLWQREALLRAAAAAFGHRLMMDCIIPGGVIADLSASGAQTLETAVGRLEAALPELLGQYERTAGLAERTVGVGPVAPAWALACAAGGPVGRASAQPGDLRRHPGYPPYDRLAVSGTVRVAGDVDARVRVRLAELGESAALLRHLLLALPDGALSVPLPPLSGEGIGWAEGAHGDIWHWLRLEGGQITAAFARDPAWLHWPLLAQAMRGGEMADVALCQASFGGGYSGMDL